jgi:hypothetical protein
MLFLLFAFLALSSAHVCLIQPLQRGPVPDLNKVGVPECGLTTGPCGQRPLGQAKQILRPLDLEQYWILPRLLREGWTTRIIQATCQGP